MGVSGQHHVPAVTDIVKRIILKKSILTKLKTVDWIHIAHDRALPWAPVNTVMNLGF
jgi:hypothetical protein